MSFLPQQEQNQQTPQGQTNTTTGAPPPTSAGSAGAGTSKSGAATASPTQFGSSSSKLGDYLTANAPQIQNQANTISGNLNNQYNQVNSDITNAANQFQTQVNNGYAAPNQSLVNQAAANPTQFVSTPGNVSAFQAQYNDTYSGPTSYEASQPYGAIQNEVTNAVQNANLLNTPSGLQTYLQNGTNYTSPAEATLDQLLLSGNPQAQQQIQTAANQFQGLNPAFTASTTNADAAAQQAQQAAQAAQQYAQSTFNPVASGFNTTLANDVSSGQTANQAAQQAAVQKDAANQQAVLSLLNQFESSLGGGNAVPFGTSMTPNIDPVISQAVWNSIGMGTPTNGIQINPNAPTIGQIATQDQFNEANALSQLLGNGYTNPLQGVTQSTYNPYLSNPGTAAEVAPILSPLAAFFPQYNAAVSGSGPYGTPGSPLELGVSPQNKARADAAYQNFLSALAPYLNS